jgi:hypothetical protein
MSKRFFINNLTINEPLNFKLHRCVAFGQNMTLMDFLGQGVRGQSRIDVVPKNIPTNNSTAQVA